MIRTAVLLLFVSFVFLGCEPEAKQKPLDVPGQKLYTLTGKIVARSAADNTLRVDHDAIPGFMEAMTMDYSVRGVKVETLPADGSRITARLHAGNDAYWLTDVKKVP